VCPPPASFLDIKSLSNAPEVFPEYRSVAERLRRVAGFDLAAAKHTTGASVPPSSATYLLRNGNHPSVGEGSTLCTGQWPTTAHHLHGKPSEAGEALTASERGELAECEGIPERGLGTFFEVGHALLKIREGRLYRPTHFRLKPARWLFIISAYPTAKPQKTCRLALTTAGFRLKLTQIIQQKPVQWHNFSLVMESGKL